MRDLHKIMYLKNDKNYTLYYIIKIMHTYRILDTLGKLHFEFPQNGKKYDSTENFIFIMIYEP